MTRWLTNIEDICRPTMAVTAGKNPQAATLQRPKKSMLKVEALAGDPVKKRE
jgi:hypothetical protein